MIYVVACSRPCGHVICLHFLSQHLFISTSSNSGLLCLLLHITVLLLHDMARPMIFNQLFAVTSILSLLVLTSTILPLLLPHFSPFTHPFRFLTLITALVLNAKTLPLVWHIRLGRHTLSRYFTAPFLVGSNGSATTSLTTPACLFTPIMTTGFHAPLMECDYNLHKSNSTYFADADMARTCLMTTLFRHGMAHGMSYPGGPAAAVKGRLSVNLGAVSAHFAREIAPYESYDVWTQVLSWDRKWIYLVSHFVRPGVVRPKGWLLQPSKRAPRGAKQKDVGGDEVWRKAVFATSVAKYVIKKGRLTIAPTECMEMSGLLPRSSGVGPSIPDTENRNGSVLGAAQSGLTPQMQKVEARRIAGLAYIDKSAEELHALFPIFKDGTTQISEGAGVEVMGEFPDMF